MEGAAADSLSSCLLQWVKSFNNVAKVGTLIELSDGLALWSILHEVDLEYFDGDLPEPGISASSDWTRKWQNLKHLERQVTMYYRDICNGQEHIDPAAVSDLKAIAANDSVRDLEKLIMIIIRSAMASPESNQKMAQRLMSLGRENAMVIANGLRNMEVMDETDYTESEPVSRDESADQSEQETTEVLKLNGKSSSGGMYQDPLLEREEELLKAQATINKLQASQAAAQQQLQELRHDKERLQEAFDNYRSDIERRGRKMGGDDAFKKLQQQADNDRAYIDGLENQLQSSRGAIDGYERQIQRQKEEGEATQKLRDDLQMVQADNEDLRQKIRASENLKKKIQTLQEQGKANVVLREELKQANEKLEEIDRLKQVQAGLEKEIIEKKGLIKNQEYQINELTTTRKHAEYDARIIAQKLQDAKGRHDRDHEAMEELRAKLRDSTLDDAMQEQTVTPQPNGDATAESEWKADLAKNDENKHLAEKLSLLEQQLETSDARLRQASERNAALEERQQHFDAASDSRGKAEQRIQDQESTIASLRQKLDARPRKSEATAPSHDIAALQRENHLMATAWYDLSNRLQNNGVSLGRRRQEPKSWIGKQRSLVGPGSSVQR